MGSCWSQVQPCAENHFCCGWVRNFISHRYDIDYCTDTCATMTIFMTMTRIRVEGIFAWVCQ